MAMKTPGEMRQERESYRNAANAQADAGVEQAMRSPQRVGGGGSGQGNPAGMFSSATTLLGAGGMPVLPQTMWGTGAYEDLVRRAGSSLTEPGMDAARGRDLQNQMLLEQLNAMQSQNARSRNTSRGAGLGGTGGAMGGMGRRVAIDRMSPYDYEEARGERAKDTRMEQELMREQMMFEQNLRSQEEEAAQKRKLEMFMQLLQRMRGGDTSTSSTNETGVSYQNVAGRPVAMPTQSSSVTRQQTPTDKLSLLRSILSGF